MFNTPETDASTENNCKSPTDCPEDNEGRDFYPWNSVRNSTPSLPCFVMHCMTFHYIASHCIALHCTPVHCIVQGVVLHCFFYVRAARVGRSAGEEWVIEMCRPLRLVSIVIGNNSIIRSE